jgi:predicted transcriptional regulator
LFESGNNKENEERKTYGLTLLEAYEHVQKETQLLQEERERLLGMEENLWDKIKQEIDDRKQKNHQLKLVIEQQKTNCMNLAKVLNASILADCSMNVS